MISLDQWKKMAEIGAHKPTAKHFSSLIDTICDEYDTELAEVHNRMDRIQVTEDGTAIDPLDQELLNDLLDMEDELHVMMDSWEEFTFTAYVVFIDQLNQRVAP